MESTERTKPNLLYRVAVGVLIFVVAVLVGISAAHSAELVPSVGVTRATDGSGEAKTFVGLALRGNLAPMLKHEFAVGYRKEEYFNGDLEVTMVPATFSIWVAPLPVLYAGGGVGIYATTYNYRDQLLIPDTSRGSFGTHVGGGLNVPLAPMVAIDLNGRYVFMGEQSTQLSQGKFNPDFWTTSLGVAIKF
jgi:outer membrane protein with beta-barrel domain